MKETAFSALILVVLVTAFATLPAAANEAKIDGKAAFLENKCVMCHSVQAEEMKAKARSAKMLGPDLSGYESKVAFETMASYVRGEIAMDGKKHTKPFKGSDEELQAIVDWLGSLEAQE